MLGTQLEIAYSDQLRGDLDLDKDLIDNVCGGQQFIEINGQRRHAISYLGDFLFAPIASGPRSRRYPAVRSTGQSWRAYLRGPPTC